MKRKDISNDEETKSKEVKNIEVDSIYNNQFSIENDSNINKNNNNLNINKKINEQKINGNLKTKNNNEEKKIYVIINKNTEKLMDSKKKTDLIQCALEYNSYLIENLIKEKNNLTQLEYDAALNRLYHNLNILTESFELYEDKYKLINTNNKNQNNNKENKNNKELNNNNETQNIDNTERIYSNSITNIEMELPL